MKGRAAALAAVLLPFSPFDAHAHTVIDGIGGFPGGLLHPFLVPAHALALVALGCLAGTLGLRYRLALIGSFIAVSVVLVAMAVSATNAELVVLALGAAAGLLLASGWKVSLVSIPLAICVAAAVMLDSVPAVLSVQETILSLAGTGLAATSIVAAIAFLSAAGPQVWQQIGIRIFGSWIAASTIMVLALRMSA